MSIDTTASSKKPLTPRFRVSFPNVFEKAAFNGGTARYSVVGLFYPKQFTDEEKILWKKLAENLDEACQKLFRKPLAEMRKNPQFKFPIRKGDEKTYDGYGDPDMRFFTMANSTRAPRVIDARGNKIELANREEFYAGCWARASYNCYAFDTIGKGVSVGLSNLQKLSDDSSFDGTSSAEDDFGTTEGFTADLGDDFDDPTA